MGTGKWRFPWYSLVLPVVWLSIYAWVHLVWKTSGSTPPGPGPIKVEEEPSPHQAQITVHYDGQPFVSAQVVPSFWFRNEDSGKAAEARVEKQEGKYRVRGLKPGKYGVQVTYNANTGNTVNSPGDYYSWTPFEITSGKVTDIEVHLSKVIHLLKPEDNNYVLEGWAEEGCERSPTVSTRARFSWESLGHQAEYDYSVDLIQCPYKHLSKLASGTTKDTFIDLDIPPSKENEFYLLDLDARRNGRRVGILMTWGPNFLAWDYRFRVK